MEAPLLTLILYVAAFSKACITQYFAQHHFQCVGTHLLHGSAIFVGYLLEAFPADVEGCTIAVSGVYCSIDVAP